jgi:hypothetical protein
VLARLTGSRETIHSAARGSRRSRDVMEGRLRAKRLITVPLASWISIADENPWAERSVADQTAKAISSMPGG